LQLDEVAKLRRNWASESIILEGPETRNETTRLCEINWMRSTSRIINVLKDNAAMMSVQSGQLSEIAEQRRNSATELIGGEVPEKRP